MLHVIEIITFKAYDCGILLYLNDIVMLSFTVKGDEIYHESPYEFECLQILPFLLHSCSLHQVPREMEISASWCAVQLIKLVLYMIYSKTTLPHSFHC